ncbi:hypothetical protein, partial [Daejeonella sp.]|uniref:hypothetical protein n=1 Tax=Daejeonella sp. TaxID=2805397 RepID=UPI003983CDEF
MKTYNENREELMVELVKFSIFYILLIITVNGFATQNGSSRFQDPPGLSAMQSRVRQIYTSQIGIREKQPNSGPAVEAYLRYVNLPKGNPWCAAFVCWTFGRAGVVNPRSGWSPDLFPASKTIFERGKLKAESGMHNSYTSSLATGTLPRLGRGSPSDAVQLASSIYFKQPGLQTSTQLQIVMFLLHTKWARCTCGWWPRAINKIPDPVGEQSTCPSSLTTNAVGIPSGQPRTKPTPVTGDIFALYFPEKRRIAHVGFIDQWDGTWMISVEGNTNVSGSSEGDGVYRKRRLVRTV